ncbi:MAG: hypothetical protein AAGD38_19980, partial [Acidobacteriota bacterium]
MSRIFAILGLLFLSSNPVVLGQSCAVDSGNPFPVTGREVQVNVLLESWPEENRASASVGINNAIARWNDDACNEGGDDFPKFSRQASDFEQQIEVMYLSGSGNPYPQHNSSGCAEIQPYSDNLSVITFWEERIEVN